MVTFEEWLFGFSGSRRGELECECFTAEQLEKAYEAGRKMGYKQGSDDAWSIAKDRQPTSAMFKSLGVEMIEDCFETYYSKAYPDSNSLYDYHYKDLLMAYEAGWKRHMEVDESLDDLAQLSQEIGEYDEKPSAIVVTDVEEHEDGSATYSFDLDQETKNHLTTVGIELVLYCAAYGWDIQDALDSLKREG